ncbi:MAG TPA: hypothetical protein VGK54_12760 [Chloroflexota bacterium]
MIFSDTGALFALLVDDDQFHAEARGAENAIRNSHEELWTIDPMVTELWSMLFRRYGVSRADGSVKSLLARGLRCERVDPQDYERAWEFGEQWPDQPFSLADRQAFAAIERTRRYRAWSYDHHFAVVRLGPRRAIPIELVR